MLDQYTPQEIKLAREIASKLDDLHSLPCHLQLVRQYNEEHLREKLRHVLSLPEDQIKKSRAALYIYLIKQSTRYGNTRY